MTTPAPHHSSVLQAGCPSATQPTASKHWRLAFSHGKKADVNYKLQINNSQTKSYIGKVLNVSSSEGFRTFTSTESILCTRMSIIITLHPVQAQTKHYTTHSLWTPWTREILWDSWDNDHLFVSGLILTDKSKVVQLLCNIRMILAKHLLITTPLSNHNTSITKT